LNNRFSVATLLFNNYRSLLRNIIFPRDFSQEINIISLSEQSFVLAAHFHNAYINIKIFKFLDDCLFTLNRTPGFSPRFFFIM
jgi:hypothetical protein